MWQWNNQHPGDKRWPQIIVFQLESGQNWATDDGRSPTFRGAILGMLRVGRGGAGLCVWEKHDGRTHKAAKHLLPASRCSRGRRIAGGFHQRERTRRRCRSASWACTCRERQETSCHQWCNRCALGEIERSSRSSPARVRETARCIEALGGIEDTRRRYRSLPWH